MTDDFLQIVIPFSLALVAAVPGILAYFHNRRRQVLDESDSAVDAWRSMVDPMRVELDDLRNEVEELRGQVDTQRVRIRALEADNVRLTAGVALLVNQVKANGMTPVWDHDKKRGG